MYNEPVNLSISFTKSGNSKKYECRINKCKKSFKSDKGLRIHLGKVHSSEFNESELKFAYKTARSLERAGK